jgi:hypothetical protein
LEVAANRNISETGKHSVIALNIPSESGSIHANSSNGRAGRGCDHHLLSFGDRTSTVVIVVVAMIRINRTIGFYFQASPPPPWLCLEFPNAFS